MALKGFDSMYEEEETVKKKPEPEPLPGTYEQLRKVWEKKKKEAVDRSLLTTTEPPLQSEAHLLSEAPLQSKRHSQSKDRLTTSQSKAPSQSKARLVKDHDGGLVRISNNYCFMDRDILRLFKDLKEAELRIYLDLLTRTWFRHVPKNICTCSNREMTETTGISSSASFAKVFKALEAKNLIKRLLISRSVNERTLFRVYLPCELKGTKSTTQIQYIEEDDDLH